VPARYAVYTGGRVFRRHTACVHDGKPGTCVKCRRMAISMISAYQLDFMGAGFRSAHSRSVTVTGSKPVEDSGAGEWVTGLVVPVGSGGPDVDVAGVVLQGEREALAMGDQVAA